VCIGSTIGKMGRAATTCATNQQINALIPDVSVDGTFVYYALLRVSHGVRRLAGNTAVPIINKSEFAALEIPLPPLAEQRRIAEILSTWDAAIEQTEKLIAAKERRKRALMQQLLTGKRRFREFEGEGWRRLQMKDAFERITDPVPETVQAVLSITAKTGFVDQREKFSKVIAGKAFKNYVHLKRGEFSYNKGNSLTYPQGCIYRLKEFDEGAAPAVYFSFRIRRPDVEGEFYRFYFLHGLLNPQLRGLISSSARGNGLLNVDAEDFFNMRIDFPSLAEQQKIAAILNTADLEVVQLKKQLAALRRQKQGLMQVLLTGKVRTTSVREDPTNAKS
jgi:type I restriction enzyme S subunit